MSALPIANIISHYQILTDKLSEITNTQELIKASKEQKRVEKQYILATKIQSLEKQIQSNNDLLSESNLDPELKELTQEDNVDAQKDLVLAEDGLLALLAPVDKMDDSNVIVEIRAGAGGDESSLFSADLLKMYTGLCSRLGFVLNVVSKSENSLGGFKEVIVEVRGQSPYSWFKYEGGVHRVQRVPTTEKQGRIHTSTCSVAVMPLIEETSDFQLNMKEVEITATTSSGHGGQSVNTTYSAIKAKHLPTGLEAQCQDERNQQQNKVKALQVLASRVYDFYEQERLAKEYAERKSQVGKADRSEKIRTYNFPQDRITDHRYNKSWNQMEVVLTGGILEILEDIKKIEAENNLKAINQSL